MDPFLGRKPVGAREEQSLRLKAVVQPGEEGRKVRCRDGKDARPGDAVEGVREINL